MMIIRNLEVHFDVAKGSDKEVFARMFEEHITAWQLVASEGERRRRLSECDRAFTDQDREDYA